MYMSFVGSLPAQVESWNPARIEETGYDPRSPRLRWALEQATWRKPRHWGALTLWVGTLPGEGDVLVVAEGYLGGHIEAAIVPGDWPGLVRLAPGLRCAACQEVIA